MVKLSSLLLGHCSHVDVDKVVDILLNQGSNGIGFLLPNQRDELNGSLATNSVN